MTFLEEVRRKVEKEEKACATCGNLVRIGGTLIGCVAHDKLILPNYPPFFGQKPCRTGSPDPGMAQKKRQGVPPAIQYSIFEGGDVFVCPFCCADLARTEAGIPRKCPECGQPIERKQSHDWKKA